MPFIIAGSAASLAGGLNAITKSTLEFEENVVVISQCINAGDIAARSGSAGGMVGKLQDASILRDCLNTGNGPGFGSPFASDCGSNVEIRSVISLSGNYSSWKDAELYTHISNAVVYKPGVSADEGYNCWINSRVTLMDVKEIADPSSYTEHDSGWKIGADATSRWKLGSAASNTFPVPYYSEMRDL